MWREAPVQIKLPGGTYVNIATSLLAAAALWLLCVFFCVGCAFFCVGCAFFRAFFCVFSVHSSTVTYVNTMSNGVFHAPYRETPHIRRLF